jgi:AmmeMemoRadiSam system protein B
MKTIEDIRPSPIAGTWYPSNEHALVKQLDQYLSNAEVPKILGEVIAVITPHAGLRYSGPVAGHAFRMLQGTNPEMVAVISPMHHPYYDPLLTTSHQAYATPLGNIIVNHDLLRKIDTRLKKNLGFGLVTISKDPEHSLEIELPFLQRVIESPFSLIPIMIRDQNIQIARILGEALAEALKGLHSILVASTDLSHFYPQQAAKILDSEILGAIEAFDPEGVIEIEQKGKGFACGRGAVASVLFAAKIMGANKVRILNYATSGDITGDFSQVVGYGAAVVYKNDQ